MRSRFELGDDIIYNMSPEGKTFEKDPRRSAVVAMIAERGLESGEAKEMLNRWISETSKRMDSEDSGPLSRINFQIELAELLLEAGEKEEAEEVLWEALFIADSEAHTDTPAKQQVVHLKHKVSRMLEEL